MEDPAFFVLAKLKSLGAVVDGDAAVAGSTPATLKRKQEDTVIPDAAPASLAITDRPPKKQKNGPSQAQIAGGKFTHNKRGPSFALVSKTDRAEIRKADSAAKPRIACTSATFV